MINQLPPPSDRIANGQRADAEQLRLDAATLALRLAQWLEGPAPMLDDDTDYTRSAAVALRVMVDALAADDPHRAAAVLYDEAADDGSPMNGYLTTAACGGLYAGAIADLALEASDL